VLIARVVHLVAAALWISAAVGGLWAARGLRRGRTRVTVYLLVSLGFVVGADNLVLAMALVRPLRPIHLAAMILLDVAGVLALVLNVMLVERLARDEDLVRVLSQGHLDGGESVTRAVARPLSPREIEVLRRLCRGQASDQIASELYLSRNTVETHIRNLRQKLGASSRADAVGWAVRAGIYDPDTGKLDPLLLLGSAPQGHRLKSGPWLRRARALTRRGRMTARRASATEYQPSGR
jgi:DNA-binding CsgD family transcriptional regulator